MTRTPSENMPERPFNSLVRNGPYADEGDPYDQYFGHLDAIDRARSDNPSRVSDRDYLALLSGLGQLMSVIEKENPDMEPDYADLDRRANEWAKANEANFDF